MKKLFYVLLLSIFILPLTAKADMGAPMFRYKVRVSNKNGAQVYEYIYSRDSEKSFMKKTDEVIPFDTVLTFSEEKDIQDKKGDEYVTVCKSDNNCNYVLAADIALYDKVDLNDYKNENEEEYYVLREGAYLYNGPSYIFGKTSDNYMIPVGTKLKSKYYDELFAYVEVDGHKGWVYVYEFDESFSPYDQIGYVGRKYNKEQSSGPFYSVNEMPLYKDLAKTEKADAKFPANTLIEPEYIYQLYAHNAAYQIKYNGENYWLIDSFFGTKEPNTDGLRFFAFTDLKIYKSIKVEDYEVEGVNYTGKTIPKFSKVKYDFTACGEYGEACLAQVTYDGVTGWVLDNEENKMEYEGSHLFEDYPLLEELKIYNSPTDKKESKTLSVGDKVYVISYDTYNYTDNSKVTEKWCYIISKNAEGWAIYEDVKIEDPYGYVKPNKPNDNDDPDIREVDIENNRKKPLKKIDKDDNRIILYSVIGGVVVVLASVVSIVLINKKKKNKNILSEEVIEETKEEPTKEVKEEVNEVTEKETKPVKKPTKKKTVKEKVDE